MKIKFAIAFFAILIAATAIFFVLSSEHALVTHPKGIIAHRELKLIVTNILLMLIVVVPTLVFLFWTLWKKKDYDPDHSYGVLGQVLLWFIPSAVIAVMAIHTWKATHELDPYQPLKSDVKPLSIQVVAIDWKWLFIYPEEGIAAVNFVQFPAKTPIQFSLSADGSPMNSFWIPELSGQIYSMTGMVTPLHIMADERGEYRGRAAEINGEGFADMTFIAKSTSRADFDEWVATVKREAGSLDYEELLKPSKKNPIVFYANVENDLFNKIVMKYMHP